MIPFGSRTYGFEKLMDKLQDALSVLPRVDPDGSSECPFAEQLFAQKEEPEAEVIKGVSDMKDLLQSAQDCVREARQKVKGKWVDPKRYELASNAKMYYDARSTDSFEEACYLQALCDHKRIQNALERADELLRKSRAKQWPLGRPKRRFG
jgi:hypothetical protein